MVVEILPDSLPLLLFVAGILLTAAEAVIPGAHFIVIGVALSVAGLLGLLAAPLATPLALAATTLLFGALAFYVYREFDFYSGNGTGQPRDSDDLKGSYGRVTERVTESGGEVKLKDGGFNPFYRARSLHGEEIPVGAEVMVIDSGGGNVVTVTATEELTDDIDRELEAGRDVSASADRTAEREPETDT
ncbi:protease [Halobacteriales archaeon QS_1_68_20]|nr:MAG: protease [Halobacteriales archaeon QS_1_68_20]